MKITCPNCGARFAVPDAALGAKGRTLKCARCAHKWHQAPGSDPGADAGAASATPARRPPPPPPSADHRPLAEHLTGASGGPEIGASPEPEPDRRSRADVDAGSALPMSREPDVPSDPMDQDRDRGRDDWRRGPDSDDDDGAEPDFDDILARLESQERERSGRAGRTADDSDDLFGDDDELPGVLRGRLSERGSGRRRNRPPAWASWTMVGVLLVAGALGALYFLRYNIIEVYPKAEEIYASLGVPLDRPGFGLWLRERGSTREMIGGQEVLVVRGFITNVSEVERPVPALRLALTDADGNMVQQKTDPPPSAVLAPGETVPYEIMMRDRMPEGVGIVVTFAGRAADPILTPPPRGN